jgi:hypothetical protein
MTKMVRSLFLLLSLDTYCWLQDPLAPGIDLQQQQQASLYYQDQQTQHWPVQHGAETTGNNGEV